MLSKDRKSQIHRIKEMLELHGYSKTYESIHQSWDLLRRGGLCMYTLEERDLIVGRGRSCEIAVLDTLFYMETRLKPFKKFKVWSKEKLRQRKSTKNWEIMDKDRKNNLGDFLKAVGENKIKDRGIRF